MIKNNEQSSIRPPLTAGQFYPVDAQTLQAEIGQYLDMAPGATATQDVGAIMVPHAGYDFSGPVAANAYKVLAGRDVDTVIIFCNSHAMYFDGIAVDTHDAWRTPLGDIAVDKELAQKIVSFDKSIQFNDKPFSVSDQTIEAQLPFLQSVLKPGFKILPIYFGNSDDQVYKKLAAALAANLGDDDLVIASSDMSHYPNYVNANKIDQETLKIIQADDIQRLDKHVDGVMNSGVANEETLLCGIDGVKTVMELYKLKGWQKIEILHYANSGDVPIGNKDSVVGYGAVVFIKGKKVASADVLSEVQQKQLLQIAKTAIESFVQTGKIADFTIVDPQLNQPQGAFVTLTKKGELRGCIGQIVPTQDPLWQVVRDMAIAAASEDHRFLPVSEDELSELDYEISVLSVPEQIKGWQRIGLGKHGVIVKDGRHSGVFLPQVATETGWSKEEFLTQLCTQKAGLPASCYRDKNVQLLVFTAQVF